MNCREENWVCGHIWGLSAGDDLMMQYGPRTTVRVVLKPRILGIVKNFFLLNPIHTESSRIFFQTIAGFVQVKIDFI